MKMLLKHTNPEHATNSMAMDSHSDDMAPIAVPPPDLLDDVFGAGPPTTDRGFLAEDYSQPRTSDRIITEQDLPDGPPEAHPSDMHRLQQEHTTAGYRDGITIAKASSVQSGFDEGFGLGATIGLKVGRLLGLLEGIAGALANEPSLHVEQEEVSSLLAGAREELDLRIVLGGIYWNNDGTWKYNVPGESEAGAVLFSHVAEAHPLIRQWTALVEIQMRKYDLREQLPLLQRPEEDGEDTIAEPADKAKAKAKATAQSQAEAKAPSAALSW